MSVRSHPRILFRTSLILWSMAALMLPAARQLDEATPTPASETPSLATATATTTLTDTPSPTDTPTPSETAATVMIGTVTPGPTATNTELPPATIVNSPTATVRPVSVPRLTGQFEPDEVLVSFKRRAAAAGVTTCLQGARASVEDAIDDLAVFRVKVPNDTVAESIALLSSCPETRFAEPNYIASVADTIPSDPNWGLQYGLLNIRAPQGWDLSTGSAAVVIAVVDTGVDLGHPDLSAKIVSGYDFVNGDSTPQDDNGHGTHVAGIAAATSNNNTGVAGVSWGALIMPVKVLNAGGNGSFADVSAGIVWAADHGAQVINLSLGGGSDSAVLRSAVDYAYGKGAVIVAAAGNSGAGSVLFPARYPDVIAVGATDSSNTHASFSNFGPELDVAAPGSAIYSTWPGGSYHYLSGTSMAAPYVSGLAAILRGIPGIGSPDVIAWYIETSALDLGAPGVDSLYGHGLIQMDRAIRRALPPTATPPSPPAGAIPGGSGFMLSTITLAGTASPTASFTATSTAVAAASATPAPVETIALSPSGTAEVSAQQVSAGKLVTGTLGSQWPLGCSGIGLIALGILLGAVLRKRQRRRRPGNLHFRTR